MWLKYSTYNLCVVFFSLRPFRRWLTSHCESPRGLHFTHTVLRYAGEGSFVGRWRLLYPQHVLLLIKPGIVPTTHTEHKPTFNPCPGSFIIYHKIRNLVSLQEPFQEPRNRRWISSRRSSFRFTSLFHLLGLSEQPEGTMMAFEILDMIDWPNPSAPTIKSAVFKVSSHATPTSSHHHTVAHDTRSRSSTFSSLSQCVCVLLKSTLYLRWIQLSGNYSV